MTRTEFLKLLGVGVIAMTGLGNFLASVSNQATDTQTADGRQANAHHGFGSGKFGV